MYITLIAKVRIVSFFRAERGGIHEPTVAWHRLPGEELAGLDLIGYGELVIGGVLGGRFGVAGGVLSLEYEVENGPGHDGAERAQSRQRFLGERRHQSAVVQRHGQEF